MARAILAKRARQDLITEKVYIIFTLADLASLLKWLINNFDK